MINCLNKSFLVFLEVQLELLDKFVLLGSNFFSLKVNELSLNWILAQRLFHFVLNPFAKLVKLETLSFCCSFVHFGWIYVWEVSLQNDRRVDHERENKKVEELLFTLMSIWRHRKHWFVVVHTIGGIFQSHLLRSGHSTHFAEKRELPARDSFILITWIFLEFHLRFFMLLSYILFEYIILRHTSNHSWGFGHWYGSLILVKNGHFLNAESVLFLWFLFIASQCGRTLWFVIENQRCLETIWYITFTLGELILDYGCFVNLFFLLPMEFRFLSFGWNNAKSTLQHFLFKL